MREISVLVVADGRSVANGLERACAPDRRLSIVGPVPDAGAAAAAVLADTPQVIVVDLDRHDSLGIDVLARVHELVPQIRILTASSERGPDETAQVLARGGTGVLPEPFDAALLRDAFERAIDGELVLPDADLALIVARLQHARWRTTEVARFGSLTPREQQVLGLIAEGCPTLDIAVRLTISAQTVQSHVKNILAKLGVHSKVEAVRVAWRCGATSIPA